jgi:UDP-2,4-diacetamido-2,4,6-trideoxy-beta-L-altropyranose hydrolase
MAAPTPAPTSGRLVFRCDGDELLGAGHVARCIPLAAAFAQLGWDVSFVGEHRGLAAWLRERAGMPVRAPEPDAPCGIARADCDAAVVDSYSIAPAAICELARALPVATLAEASRCPTLGVLIDYHLDRAPAEEEQLLAGPSFAPLDPAFAGAGRAGPELRRVLVTLGGSQLARELLVQVLPGVCAAFEQAEVLVAGEIPRAQDRDGAPRLVSLPSPSALVDVVGEIDLAITAAGLSAYELACAGIPQLAIGIVENQRRVVAGLRQHALAPCIDLTAGESLAQLPDALRGLLDEQLRERLAERGRRTFDGDGARRAAQALSARWRAG